MTGKEWTIIRGSLSTGQPVEAAAGVQGAGIIGIASKSNEEPLRTDFKDTALEQMGTVGLGPTPDVATSVSPASGFGTETQPATLGGAITKYSEWKFIADKKNDHTKIYRAYHEGW